MKVKVTDAKLIRVVCEISGAAQVLSDIEAAQETTKLAGLTMANAIASKVVAEARVLLAVRSTREATKAGIDITANNISIGFENGDWYLIAEPFDLVELAE